MLGLELNMKEIGSESHLRVIINNRIVFCTFLFSLFLMLIPQSSCAQQKVVLKKGLKRSHLTNGNNVIPVLKNGDFSHLNWQNFCKKDESFQADSLWRFTGVSGADSLMFERVKTFLYDTLSAEVHSGMTRAEKKQHRTNWQEVSWFFGKEEILYLVYRKPILHEKLIVNITEIESFRFASVNDCANDFRVESGIIAALGVITLISAPFTLGLAPMTIAYMGAGAASILIFNHVVNSYRVKEYPLDKWKLMIK